ncbi:MAG: DUF2264 domain-containing protein [Clostridia bacterium]|nr:DUF2264 domain-containing protein [Clostridia bacterium]
MITPLSPNPLITRDDLAQAATEMIQPLLSCLTPARARMIVGEGSAHYSEDIAGMEGFSRVLWALVPMLIGHVPSAEGFWRQWKQGLIHGTDPQHAEYWGDVGDFDQRMVEMAVIGTGLCFAKEYLWDDLTAAQQENLYAWLNQINLHDMPTNNWRFFRILVNLGFLKTGCEADRDRLKEDLDLMESHYVGDGWYFDAPTKRDYYTIWGFHFYSLVYVAAMRGEDPERCERFVERARLIAPRFAQWFDREGRSIPYGRSLTYRFCQGSFWAAMAFAGVTVPEAGLGWGEIRHFLLGNLRFWLQMPIFDRHGALTVGYGYPNLCAAEGYNAPGSPYWGMKTFFALALPEDHPFWQAEERAFSPKARFLDEQVRLLITRDPDNTQVLAYTAGNHAWEHMHEDEKYEKFCYSTHFAFSVVKEATTLTKGAFDSMLALKRQGRDLWHARSGCERFQLTEEKVTFTWSPMEDVVIESTIAPLGMWHVRKHVIRTRIPIDAAEGAFAVRRDWAGNRPCDRIRTELFAGPACAVAHGAYGTSAIYALEGYEKGENIFTEPNTNLMYPRTVLPTLHARLEAGTWTLVCAVYACSLDDMPEKIPEEVRQLAGQL